MADQNPHHHPCTELTDRAPKSGHPVEHGAAVAWPSATRVRGRARTASGRERRRCISRGLRAVEFCEAGVVVPHHFSIECDTGFHGRQGTRDTGATVEGAVVEERIAAVQHPSVAGIDGHTGVLAGPSGSAFDQPASGL